MSEFDDEPTFDGGGYDVDDWARLKPFTGALATLEDVQAKVAIFALGDTHGGRPIDMELPQPIIWWEDDGEVAAVVDTDLGNHIRNVARADAPAADNDLR